MAVKQSVFSLESKMSLVTGAASGIGAAIAEAFARAGATVWIADRDETNGRYVAERIGGKFIRVDVSNEADCTEAAKKVGMVNVLVNVAGIGHVGSLPNTVASDLDRLF